MTASQLLIVVASLYLGGITTALGIWLFVEKKYRKKKEIGENEIPEDKAWMHSKERVVVELGDFVNPMYKCRFTINGEKWVFEFRESSVSEIFKLLRESGAFEEETKKDEIQLEKKMKRAIFDFLKTKIPNGKTEGELEEAISAMPPEGIAKIHNVITKPMTERVLDFGKKKTKKTILRFLSLDFWRGLSH